MSSITERRARGQQLTEAIVRLEPERFAWPLMALATIVACAVLYHLTRQTSFWADEWLWITGRRANTIGTFLQPHNGHLSLVPIAIYRVMFAVFGIGHYAPYRVLAIAAHVACALLVFAYVRSRLGGLIALLAGILILFLGPGWQDMLWGFQIAWSLAVAAGIAAFLLLDRHERRSDIAACVLIGISLASTSVGIAIALGLAVHVALTRRRWSNAWIVAVPLALYAIWALRYHPGGVIASEFLIVPEYVAKSAAAALSGLAGLSGLTPTNETGTTLEFGVPLTLLVLAAIGWLIHRRRLAPHAISLAVVLLIYWSLIPIGRLLFSQPGSSRYLYVSCIFALLLVVELARGVKFSRMGMFVVVVFTGAALLSNVGILRSGAAYLRLQGTATNADLAALNLVRSTIPAGYKSTSLPLSVFNPFDVHSYFAAQQVLGTPAYSTAQLAAADPNARTTSDDELLHAGEIDASSTQSRARLSGAPAVVQMVSSGAVSAHGSCLSFGPSSVTTPGVSTHELTLAVPRTGVRIDTSQSPVTLSVRRFGASFESLGTLGVRQAANVTVRADQAAQPWVLQIGTSTITRICTLAPA